jgi:predicted ATPase
LERLGAAELIFSRGTPPEASYSFKHALVRDAAHESLLKAQRQRIHARIVKALEEHFPKTKDTEPELLARHCAEAGLAGDAADYWLTAGRQALARSAMTEAVAQLTKGLDVLNRLPRGPDGGPERLERELGLQLALGQASIAAKGFAASETGRAYARARELCAELGNRPELFPVLYGRSVFHFQRGEVGAAFDVAGELLRLARERGDEAAQVTGHGMVGSALCQSGRLPESREHFEAALDLYDDVRDRNSCLVYVIDSRVMSLSWLAHIYFLLGYPERALAMDAKVPAYVGAVAHPNTTAVAASWGCMFHQLYRNREKALAQAEEAMRLSAEQGFPLYLAAGTVVRGWALADAGQVEAGVAEIGKGLADYGATGALMWSPYFLGLLAEALDRAGRVGDGLKAVAEALSLAERTGVRWIEADLHRLRGDLLAAGEEPRLVEAEACFRRALEVAREQGALMWELRAATGLARCLRDQGGRRREVRDLLASIYGGFTEGFDAPDLRDAKAMLEELGAVT